MAKQFPELSTELIEFIADQKLFFVGTAAEEGRVNISPKGMDSLRVIGSDKIVWLNLTGSGNETAAHLIKNNRMTIMFCAFEGKPLILRVYGKSKIYHKRDRMFNEYLGLFPAYTGARQIIDMEIEMVQTSCGYAVPFMDFREERSQLISWAEKQGEERLMEYRRNKNSRSIDGFETGIIEN